MKVRNGFVSNSSSSSFIINIQTEHDSEAFLNDLYRSGILSTYEFKDFFLSSEEFITTRPHIGISKEDFEWIYETLDKDSGAYFTKLTPEETSRIMGYYFKLHHVYIKDTNDDIEIAEHITMYNDDGDWSGLLKDIIFFLNLLPVDFTWDIDND